MVDGQLEELENEREPGELVEAVVELAQEEPSTVAGFDFAFSFPRWYADQQGWTSGPEVWQAMKAQAEDILGDPKPPFWGRKGSHAQTLGKPFRATDYETPGAKSVFQIAGAGAVGTGSLRGMPHLLRLSDAFAIWPFDDAKWPLALEIYPRLLTGPVLKTRHRARRGYLEKRFPDQNSVLRERAAGSEDAFDAAVSALVLGGLEKLPPPGDRLEGAIWRPGLQS